MTKLFKQSNEFLSSIISTKNLGTSYVNSHEATTEKSYFFLQKRGALWRIPWRKTETSMSCKELFDKQCPL